MSRKHSRYNVFLVSALTIGMAVFLLSIGKAAVFWSALASELSVRGGTAPDVTFAKRQAWGAQTFGAYSGIIENWVSESSMIQADLRKVSGVAPIGGPNRFYPGFTDGAYAQMRLEVVGNGGTGILTLPYVEVCNSNGLTSVGDHATWQFGETTHVIHKNGQGYLTAFGLNTICAELLQLADSGQDEQFLDRWSELELSLASSALPPPWSAPGKEPPLIQQLHDHYREPLLERYGDAQAATSGENIGEAVEAYRLAAKSMLERAEACMEKDSEFHNTQVTADLRNANRVLRRANERQPNDRKTLLLARKRSVLQYLFSIGCSPSAPFTEDPNVKQRWNEHCLGVFFTEAVNYANRSPYLRRELGRYRVEPDARNDSRLSINDDNVFAANVRLRVTGWQEDGLLTVRIRENEDRVRPVDIFADEVRPPDYPLRTTSPYWDVVDEPRVKLSAKTGEAMKQRLKSSR